MATACNSVKGRSNITKALKAYRANYEKRNYVYNAALLRVPEEWRDKFHAEALKGKRGQPKEKRQPRKAEASVQGQASAEAWKAALLDRKRAFSSLGSKAVTAYKKRCTADRTRVAKKFFLDNGLPAPQPEDIAENDAGLPRATTSTRATFVEHWCKFGSFAICKQCRSLQPRPLEFYSYCGRVTVLSCLGHVRVICESCPSSLRHLVGMSSSCSNYESAKVPTVKCK